MDTDEKYVQIPEEYSRRKLNALYREIPLKDTTSRLLRKYFNAMANLYGVIPLGKALEIIESQNPGLVSKEGFFAFAEIARHECEDYCILRDDELYLDSKMTGRLDWLLIDIPLLYEHDDALREVRICQQNKEYYIPKKTELLRYDDSSYCEPTPQAQRLRDFLSGTLRLEPQDAETAFEEILLQTRCLGGGLQAMINVVEAVGGTFSDRQMTEFVAIQQDFNNNTRMHHNRGYTPNEILAMAKPEDRVLKSLAFGPGIRKSLADGSMDPDKLRRDFLTMDVPDEQLRTLMLQALDEAQVSVPKAVKIGRNDPCPCGSGKKYKKCCGR